MTDDTARLVEQRMVELLACQSAMTRLIEAAGIETRSSLSSSAAILAALPGNVRLLVADAARAIRAHLGEAAQGESLRRLLELERVDAGWRLAVVTERYTQLRGAPGWRCASDAPYLEIEMRDGARFEMAALLSALRVGRLGCASAADLDPLSS